MVALCVMGRQPMETDVLALKPVSHLILTRAAAGTCMAGELE